ncbi:adenylate/guanylate cyclase domain-containing protein [Desertibaculum subflavum]|uniref:adenylate/guanylate cyclase domain-containing protein n=1 Tax=Desertibaculum subflavum TaxID=2268458 RepID=UPI0034D38EF8
MTEPAAHMDLARFREMLLQSAGVGLAIVHRRSGAVLFHNQRFAEWFPAAGEADATLARLLPALDLAGLEPQLAADGTATADVEVKPKRRPIQLLVRLEASEREGAEVLIVECQNVSKLRELEFMIESYSKMIERQNRDLTKEKERVERLLLNIMPKTVYEEWKSFGVTTPQRYDASVLTLDFVDFTEMAVTRDPPALIGELNDIFTAFDRIVEQFGCERIKTIGDGYIAVSGIPERTPDHAQNVAKVALRFVRYLNRRNASSPNQWRCRIGLASGPVIGSIVGIQKYVYDIFGEGVNMAARMEEVSGPMQITLPETMRARLRGEFQFGALRTVDLKGFGATQICTLEGGGALLDEIPI